jgi:hypothetical protein
MKKCMTNVTFLASSLVALDNIKVNFVTLRRKNKGIEKVW